MRWVLSVLVALVIIGGFVVAGRIHDHRPVHNSPAPAVPVSAPLFADRAEPVEWMPADAPETEWWNAATQTLRPVPIGGRS